MPGFPEPNAAQKGAITSMNTQQLETGWLLNLLRNIATAGMQQKAPMQNGGIPAPPPGSPAANFLQLMQGGGMTPNPGQAATGQPAPNAQPQGTVQPGNPAPQSGMQQPAPSGPSQTKPDQSAGAGKSKNSAVQNIGAGAEGDGAANAFMKALQFVFGGSGG